MFSLKNKIVCITGASAGIGRACAYSFAEQGADIIISARRIEKVNAVAKEIRDKFGVKVFAFKLDVRNHNEVVTAFEALPEEWRKIDVLINNAGLGRGLDRFYEDDVQNWEEMIDTNIKGLLYVSSAVVPGMAERKSGQIINLGSIAGRMPYPKGSVYCATKSALDAITKSMRMDLSDKNVRVSTVDPGMVETDFSIVRFHGDELKAKNVYKGIDPLTADDIADAILYCATRPPHVNISEILIMPTAQANSFVAHRSEE